jgi:hypothetical protein
MVPLKTSSTCKPFAYSVVPVRRWSRTRSPNRSLKPRGQVLLRLHTHRKALNVDDPEFIECVPPPCHNGPGGLHSNQDGPGTNWNSLWQQSMDQNPRVTPSEIRQFLNYLKYRFGSQLNCQ